MLHLYVLPRGPHNMRMRPLPSFFCCKGASTGTTSTNNSPSKEAEANGAQVHPFKGVEVNRPQNGEVREVK